MTRFHRPALPGDGLFATRPGGPDPAEVTAAGQRVAHLLVRGARDRDDAALVDRVVRLADTEGLQTLADLWRDAPPDSLAGCLWRLYLLRTWVHRQPAQAAREFTAGKVHAPVQEMLAGVVDAPSPEDVVHLVDTLLSGVVRPDVDVAFDRAASFAQVVAVGRGQLDQGDPHSAARLFDTATQLRHAAALERAGELH